MNQNERLIDRIISNAQLIRFAQVYKSEGAPKEKIEEQRAIADNAWQEIIEVVQTINAKPQHTEKSIATLQQPVPVFRPGKPAIADLVCAELESVGKYPELCQHLRERKELGVDRYGVPLQVGNGRSPLIDLYQELLDAIVYSRQAVDEGFIVYARHRDIVLMAESVRKLCQDGVQ